MPGSTRPPILADPAALLYPAEAAHLVGLGPRTVEGFRRRGGGPAYIAIGGRCVRYRRGDLLDWIETRRRDTSDPGSAG